ncbi:hypothetical protein BG20_I2428, partial [Candidatus Nitrosarchaeum limnium BG20]
MKFLECWMKLGLSVLLSLNLKMRFSSFHKSLRS